MTVGKINHQTESPLPLRILLLSSHLRWWVSQTLCNIMQHQVRHQASRTSSRSRDLLHEIHSAVSTEVVLQARKASLRCLLSTSNSKWQSLHRTHPRSNSNNKIVTFSRLEPVQFGWLNGLITRRSMASDTYFQTSLLAFSSMIRPRSSPSNKEPASTTMSVRQFLQLKSKTSLPSICSPTTRRSFRRRSLCSNISSLTFSQVLLNKVLPTDMLKRTMLTQTLLFRNQHLDLSMSKSGWELAMQSCSAWVIKSYRSTSKTTLRFFLTQTID